MPKGQETAMSGGRAELRLVPQRLLSTYCCCLLHYDSSTLAVGDRGPGEHATRPACRGQATGIPEGGWVIGGMMASCRSASNP